MNQSSNSRIGTRAINKRLAFETDPMMNSAPRKSRTRRNQATKSSEVNDSISAQVSNKMNFNQLKVDLRLIIYELSECTSKYPDTAPFPTWTAIESSMFLIASYLGDLVALQAMKTYQRIAVFTDDTIVVDEAHDKAMSYLTFAARCRCFGSEFTTNLASGGHLKCLIWAHQQGCLIEKDNAIEGAASGGHIHVIRWLRSPVVGCDWTPKLCSIAAMNGHLTLLKWLKQEHCPWSENMFSAAARKGHVQVLDWLQQEALDIDDELCSTAAEHDQIHVLQWMSDRGIPMEYVFKYAVRAGCTQTILWLLNRGYSWDPDSFVVAIEKGNLELLRWLKRRGCPWDGDTFVQAALTGRLEILKWLRRNSCPWDSRTFAAAARCNDMSIIRWLHRVKCPCDERAMQAAAATGDLSTLMFLYRMKYPWDHRTGISAAEHCSMYTLMWLRDVGCPWDDVRCKEAAKRNPNTQAREWIQMDGYTYFVGEHA